MWRGLGTCIFVLEEWRQCLKQQPYANFLINELFLFAISWHPHSVHILDTSYTSLLFYYILFGIYLNKLSYIQTNFNASHVLSFFNVSSLIREEFAILLID